MDQKYLNFARIEGDFEVAGVEAAGLIEAGYYTLPVENRYSTLNIALGI
jgi:hypothetical protein